ncbi:hypothetical protein EIP91_004045 [Steccherinum ochraceum]|uniref:Uncharacterized protein n=1 Tax=Steccherinum ochraceum TaxID=92696 RepID=A0A4R0RQ11_9APHY|nr:hypothetical protein EIP91_004045 [Steccherinum ochraceum]
MKPRLFVDTDTASYSASHIMETITELRAPPNTPMPSSPKMQPPYGSAAALASQSNDSLASTVYSNSPIIFGNSLPWALATLELEHRLRTEEDPYDFESPGGVTILEVTPIESVYTSTTSLLTGTDESNTESYVDTFVYPTHMTERKVTRPANPKRSRAPFSFFRSGPSRAASPTPGSPEDSRPSSPVPRPVSPLTGPLKALKLIKPEMFFEEDLDFYEHRWALEQTGQAKVEVMVRKQVKVTVDHLEMLAAPRDKIDGRAPDKQIPTA